MYPEVVLAVDGIKRGVSVDIRVGSFRASGTLTGKLKGKPDNKEYKRIEMMMIFTSKMMYKVQVSNVKGLFSLPTSLSKVDMGTLLTEPKIGGYVISEYQHLKSVLIDDTDIKPKLSIERFHMTSRRSYW